MNKNWQSVVHGGFLPRDIVTELATQAGFGPDEPLEVAMNRVDIRAIRKFADPVGGLEDEDVYFTDGRFVFTINDSVPRNHLWIRSRGH